MILYVLKRLLQSIVTILLVVTIVFLLLRLLPTDYYFTEDELMKLTEEQKHDRLEAAGFLDPPLTQLGRFFKQLFTEFDLGTSRRIQANQPVVTVIGSKFGVSMRLGLISLGISLVLGVCFGVLQARYKDGIFDHIGTAYTVFVNAVPSLVTYSLVLAFGARVLGLPSMYSMRKPELSAILPIVCLSIGSIAGYMLWTRRYTEGYEHTFGDVSPRAEKCFCSAGTISALFDFADGGRFPAGGALLLRAWNGTAAYRLHCPL